MKANTAVGIGLSGVVVIAVARRWSPWWTLVTAVAVLVIGAVTSCEYLLHALWSGFDEVVGRRVRGCCNDRVPGRMGLNTAFDFVLLGIAGVLLATRRAPNLRQGLALVVIIVGTVAEMGYLLQVPAMSGHVFGILTQMAVSDRDGSPVVGSGFSDRDDRPRLGQVVCLPAGRWSGRPDLDALAPCRDDPHRLPSPSSVEQHSAEAHWGPSVRPGGVGRRGSGRHAASGPTNRSVGPGSAA